MCLKVTAAHAIVYGGDLGYCACQTRDSVPARPWYLGYWISIMPVSANRFCIALAGTLLLAAPAAVVPSAPAMAASIVGDWVGDGFVEPRDGNRESVRCRLTYRQVTENLFRVAARCASASGRIDQTGELVRVNDNRYVGDFYNEKFDVSGRARVVVNGSRQSVTVTGGAGSGRLSLRKR